MSSIMAAGAGAEEGRDLVEQKKDKKEEVAELLKRLELGQVPDDEIRRLIRLQLDRRIQWGYKPTCEQVAHVVNFTSRGGVMISALRKMKIATAMEALDSEMYEMPISFLKLMFGSTICKSSCCFFKDDAVTLEEAAIAMMDLYCERSQIKDGHRVLDLGCGQGALTMHIARKYKNCHVTGLTNSVAQKEINKLTNVEIMLADVTEHEIEDRYDRILAIGFIEHMKNYELLLRKISKWMTPDGLLFIEHVSQKTFPYHYESIDKDDWYTEYVFPAGTMIIPSTNLLLYFQDDVTVINHWLVNGKHYSRTHEMWLKNLYDNAKTIKEIMVSFTGGEEAAQKQMNYWRGFALSGMELFGYGNGEEWMASHVLFKNK